MARSRTITTWSVDIPGEQESSVDVEFAVVDNTEEITVLKEQGKMVVSYLSRDEYCESPLDSCDGEGCIFTSSRRDGKASNRGMQEALGLDFDWCPDIELPGVAVALSELVWDKIKENKAYRGVLQRILKRNGVTCTLRSVIDAVCMDRENSFFMQAFTGSWSVTESTRGDYDRLQQLMRIVRDDDTQLAAWRAGRKAGTVGNPYAVALDVYEHGGRWYSISGEGMQCRFDTARGGVPYGSRTSALSRTLRPNRLVLMICVAQRSITAGPYWKCVLRSNPPSIMKATRRLKRPQTRHRLRYKVGH